MDAQRHFLDYSEIKKRRRTSFVGAVACYWLGLVPTLLVVVMIEDGSAKLFDAAYLLRLLTFACVMSVAFIGSLIPLRPYDHAKGWPPYAATAATGAATTVSWLAFSWVRDQLIHKHVRFGFLYTPLIVRSVGVAVATCFALLLIYRVTVDRSRRGSQTTNNG